MYSDIQNVINQGFTAIDFETASYQRTSACQLGVVVVEKGGIVDSRSWLIKPPSPLFHFTYIHGITYDMVRQQPTFQELWPSIQPYIANKTLAAHNATFDISVLVAVLNHYKLEVPAFQVIDSLTVARKAWPGLSNHKLNTVASHLCCELQHHDAASDARACAEILLRAGIEQERYGIGS